MESPVQVMKKALDVTPYEHGIWCSIADGQPFVNTIVLRKWSEDGAKVVFMLDSHNFLTAAPEEEIEVVVKENPFYNPAFQEECLRKDAERMRVRPNAGG